MTKRQVCVRETSMSKKLLWWVVNLSVRSINAFGPYGFAYFLFGSSRMPLALATALVHVQAVDEWPMAIVFYYFGLLQLSCDS